MKFSHNDLYNSPNKLAEHYKNFKVKERYLLTGHSHQAWPDCGFEAQQEAWRDAAEFVDDKWERAFQKADEVKRGYLKLLDDDTGNIALGVNTLELLIRFLSALPLKEKPKLVTTDGEFHTIRRLTDRLSEEGINIVKVSSSPINDVVENLKKVSDDKTSAILVSSVFFNSGLILPNLSELAEFCADKGIKLLVDAYHSLNVAPFSVKKNNLDNAFITGGGYKYCQLGEGNCFLRFSKETDMRPVTTGWFSEFTAMSEKKKQGEVLYGTGDDLFTGATFDPVSNYRAARVFRFFEEINLNAEFLSEVSQHQIKLLIDEFDKLDANPSLIKRDRSISLENIAGFLVLYTEKAEFISSKLKGKNVWTDYRGNALRFGPAPYLSDVQIKDAMRILGDILKEVQ
jgi:selenocysteine lyase/cysteine desulfurase